MENINTSFPNDGLGDKVRTAFIKVNDNFTELSNGKVDKVIGKGLSTNDYTDVDEALVASAIQPGDLAEVATTGDYFDLINQPTSFPPSAHTHIYTDLDLSVENAFEKSELKLWKDSLNAFAELKNFDLVNEYISKVIMGTNSFMVDSDKPTFRGIVGSAFFDKLNDPLSFPQYKDITDNFIPYTGTDETLITGNFQVATQQKTFFENENYEFKYEIDDTNNWVMIQAIDKISGYKSHTTYEIGSIQQVLTNVFGSTTFNYNVQTGILGGHFYEKLNNANTFAQIGDIGTGWASYSDKNLTSLSPLIIAEGDTEILTNNSFEVIDTHIPVGVTSFYNNTTSKITPELEGDSYLINVRFKAKSSLNDGVFDVLVDIGGGIIIEQETKTLTKGISTEHSFNMVFDVYSGATFVANGALIKITSVRGDTEIYEPIFKVTRTHKAKVIL